MLTKYIIVEIKIMKGKSSIVKFGTNEIANESGLLKPISKSLKNSIS